MQSKTSSHYYIQNLNDFFDKHNNQLENTDIILGDFNNNVIWDIPKQSTNNFRKLIQKLDSHGFESLYHKTSNECLGKESVETFRKFRNEKKPFHIDYIFLNKKHNATFNILSNKKFFEHSDHCPLLMEINDL